MKKFNEIETQELYLYTVNCGNIYRARTQKYLESLRKKAAKGDYDKVKAAKGFESIALLGAQQYAKEFSHPGDEKHMFTPAVRKEVAIRMEEHYREEVLKG